MEWNWVDLAVANFIKVTYCMGENYLFNRVGGKCQVKWYMEISD